MPAREIPDGVHATYSRQFRRCNKPNCAQCRDDAPGHGPYWYAYWREDGRLRSRYIGRTAPDRAAAALPEPAPPDAAPDAVPAVAPVPRVRALGGFALWSGDRCIAAEHWRARRATALFTCLLSMPRQSAHREQLIDLLWPEASPEAGTAALRHALHRLRHLLERHATGIDCLRAGANLQLVAVAAVPAARWLDAEEFEQAARAALAGRDPARCRAALALYTGDYLPEERYADWALARREELQQLYLAILLRLAQLRERASVIGEAARCLRRVLAINPCHEQAAQALIRLLVRANRRAEAALVYQRLTTALQRQLGLPPEAQTQALYRALLAPDAGVAPATNLPTPLTTFVGHEHDLAALAALLRDTGEVTATDRKRSSPRLLTLIGMAGCGKTRLAVELGHEALVAHARGVWFVDLAPLPVAMDTAPPDQSVERVGRAIARSLDLREEPGQSMLAVVTQALRDWRALLILDNCEHLLTACATVATTLLGRCPHVRIVATSREALSVPGETLWRVRPLAVPDAAGGDDVAVLASFPALRLFVERTRTVRPTFALDPSSGPAAREICRRLDGIPLAIELAAACLGSLSLHELAGRLDDRFRLLVGGNRAAAPRHQTLQAALDWSYSLLNLEEQGLLRRLSVFVGGWSLAAAEATCTSRADDPVDVLRMHMQLTTKSLLLQVGDPDERRYGLLETVRHYAAARLTADERRDVCARHLGWYVALAEQAGGALQGVSGTAWLRTLEQEHDNLRAALAWSLENGQAPREGLRLAKALGSFWRIRGHFSEGSRWLRLALAGDDGTQPLVTAAALLAAARLAHQQSDVVEARMLGERALAVYEAHGDREGVAQASLCLASAAYFSGEGDTAVRLLDRARALFDELSEPNGLATTMNFLAGVAHDRSDLDRAMALYAESLGLFRQTGDQRGIAVALQNLGRLALDSGDNVRARALLEESLQVRRELGERWGIARSLHTLGELAQARCAWDEARSLNQEALDLFRALGARRDICSTLYALGHVAYQTGDDVRARACAEESVALAREVGSPKQVAYTQYLLGHLARRRGDPARALVLYGEGVRAHQRLGYATGLVVGLEGGAACALLLGHLEQAAILYAAVTAWRVAQREPRWPADEQRYVQDREALERGLGEGAFARAWRDGSALTLDDAIHVALRAAAMGGARREPGARS